MGDPSGPIEENGGQNGDTDGPSSLVGMGPPSPLTGCYLLIILGEPHSAEHKDIILQRLVKGFLSWDALQTHVDLEEELNTITVHAPEGEDARHGERLIQYASENLVTEILIHPQYNTLIQCMRNLLSSFTRHRHIIHAGYTFSGNGSWILQDGTFSVSDFAEAFQEHEVQRVLRAYPDTVSMDIHCDSSAGLWSVLPDKSYAKNCKIHINPVDVLDSGSDRIKAFVDYLAPMLNPANLNDLLESSDVVGNIRFSHPTLYVFPGGQGDAALFGINGFNMLVDGGFNRKACFWNFARHLDRLDAVLMTRINNSNIQGISSVIERKYNSHVYPQIGHFFCNIPERRAISSPEENKDKDSLVIDLFDKGQKMISNLKSISLKPQMCYRDIEPMNLYHKVGHGTLDMYVISPGKDSREVKEFMQKWTTNDQKLFAAKDTKDFQFPIQNLVSICALLVWQPANPEDTITRILFPGSTPDYKILEGLEKIKHLEFMKHPMCTAKKLVPSISTATITKKVLKSAINEKSIPEPILPSKTTKAEKDNQVIDNKVKNIQDNKAKESKLIEEQTVEKKVSIKPKPKKIVPKKADSLDEKQKDDVIENKDKDEESVDKPEVVINGNDINETDKKDETDVTAKPKKIDHKSKIDTKTTIKSRIDSRPPKSMDKKIIKRDTSEKREVGKHSPTTTPKKTSSDTKLTNGVPKEKEIKPKVVSRATKSSPNSTPAKSTKEANNRKVLESKQKARTIKRDLVKTIEKKEEKVERKPISHRAKGISPSRRPPDSPKKSIKPKTEKDNIIRKAKLDKGGTTDSSLVSTPSADDAIISKKVIDVVSIDDVVKQRELDDLKEEQEAVREIEEVFKREEKIKKKDSPSDHREVIQDSATEAEDDEEYLIIEKEEVEQYTEDSINEQESSMAKEEEMQKHQRDSQESEKKRKSSLQTTEEEVEQKDESEVENVTSDDVKRVEIIEPEKDTDDVQPDSIEEVATGVKLEPTEEEHIKEEVQEIISSAKEIAKTKSDSKEEVAKTDEISSPTPEDKLSITKKTSDTKDEPVKDGEVQNLPESQPFSATVESGATTAPTLPEDERIPLDEIKEDLVVEEKYIKEETKETKEEPEVPTSSVLQKTYEPLERAVPSKMNFDTTQPHLRDIVKTPDEVADLPVHEEADIETYEGSEEAKDDKKTTETKTSDENNKHQTVEDGARDIADVDVDKPKAEKIPNGSVINKAENEQTEDATKVGDVEKEQQIEEKENDDQSVKVLEEKPIFDKKVEVTGFKEKVSVMAEKVEYAVEDLGKSFENTLKDVTQKDADKIQGEKVKEDVNKDTVEVDQEKPVTPSEKVDYTMEVKEDIVVAEIQVKPESPTKDLVDQTVSGITSFIESTSKAISDKIESLVESTQVCEESKIESKEISSEKEQLEFKEVYDYSHPYGMKTFPTELRETHITTLDSPVAEKDKIIDLKILDELPEAIDEEHDDLSAKSMVPPFHPDDFKYASFEREDSNLKDIKEEEEDDRSTPPNDQGASRKESTEISDLTNKDTIIITGLDEHPPRAVSPREEEVLKIVANVAEVLKSEKDIAEIIPDFSEEELERKLRGVSPRLDDDSGTVQRMLVTASSEDGGEEIEICPEGTIKFSPIATPELVASGKVTPEITNTKSDVEGIDLSEKESIDIPDEKPDEKEEKEASESSSPEAKTSSVSIDEKEKHELPEKAQVPETAIEKLPETAHEIVTDSNSRKESVVSDYIDDIMDRRESAFSAFSEKDFTKDESSMDDSRPTSAISHDMKNEKDEEITIKTPIVGQVERPTSEQSTINDQSPEEISVISKDDKKQIEDDKASTLCDLKVEVSDERRESASSHVSDRSGVEISRPDSIISHFSDKSEPELKEKLGSSPDSIASIDKVMAYMKLTEHSLQSKTQDLQGVSQTETGEKENDGSKTPLSRPDSAGSHVSDGDKTEEFDTLRASSVISPKSESMVETSKKIVTSEYKTNDDPAVDEEKESRPISACSHASDAEEKDNKHESGVASRASSKDDKDDKSTTRPQSVGSDKLDVKDVKDESSRPPSNASIVSDKEEAKKSEHVSRPESVASSKDVKEITQQDTEKTENLQAKEKESRPPSYASNKGETETETESPSPSVASHVSDKEQIKQSTPEGERKDLSDKSGQALKDSRRPTAASNVSDKEDTKEVSKDSRPPSVASVKDEKETTRPESAISDKSGQALKDSRPPTAASNVSDKEDTKEVSKDSRPPSVASVKDEKETTRPESIMSDKSGQALKDSRPPTAASNVSDKEDMKEVSKDSRPPSVASVKDENETTRPESAISDKSGQALKDSRPPTAASNASDKEDTKEVSKDSRPPSVASVKDEKETTRPESAISDKSGQALKDSRPPTAASNVSDKEDTKEVSKDSRPPSVASVKDEKETTRPESAISDKSGQALKDSRPPTAASNASDKEDTKEVSKDSRPPSVASVKDEKETTRPESAISDNSGQALKDSRPPTAASNVSDKEDTKEVSKDYRPPSVASVKDEKETTRPESAISEKSGQALKDSRPPTAASNVSDKEDTKEVSKDSRPPSVASVKDEKETTRPESAISDKSGQALKDSRPPTAASNVSDKEDTKEVSKDSCPPSVASVKDEKETTRPESAISDKSGQALKDSRPPTAASNVSDKEDTKEVSKDSRPPSVASVKDEKETTRPESAISDKSGQALKDSRPPTAASNASDKEDTKEVSKDSRPPSVASVKDEKETTRPESAISDKSGQALKDSRPPTAASNVSDKEDTKEASKDSRPPSVASVKDEKETTRPESAISDKSGQALKDSRPPTAASNVSDKEDTKEVSKDSRPPSVASVKDEKETTRLESAISDKSGQALKDSRPPTAASNASDKEDTKEVSKDSRPPSVASVKDEKETTRPESAISDKSGQALKDSRPPTAASNISDKEDTKEVSKDSRPASVASVKDEKETTHPESVVSGKSDEKQTVSRPPSVVSHFSDKEDIQTEVHSRPVSVASTRDEKETTEKSVIVKSKDLKASRPSSVASNVSDDVVKNEASVVKSRPPSITSHTSDKEETTLTQNLEEKKESRPPSVASSVGDKAERKDAVKDSSSTTVDSLVKQQETSRPPSVASHVSDKSEIKDSRPPSSAKDGTSTRPESVISDKSDKKELKDPEQTQKDGISRPSSVISHVSGKSDTEAVTVLDEKSEEKQKDSRPSSAASHISITSKDGDATLPESTFSEKHNDSRPPSVASKVSEKSEKDPTQDSRSGSVANTEEDVKKDTRPPSSASQHVDDSKISRSGSVASAASIMDENTKEQRKTDAVQSSRLQSSASDKMPQRPESASSQVSDKADQPQKISRPTSVASNASENENSQKLIGNDTKADDRPASKQSHCDKSPSDQSMEKPKDSRSASVVSSASGVHEKDTTHFSRPGSVTSLISDKDFIHRPGSAASQISESRSRNQSRRESAVERCSADDDDEIEILKVKDSRSKSVSSIMITSMYKPDGFEPLATFEESFEQSQSKDDSVVGSSSRKASGLSDLIDDVKKIDVKLVSTQIEDKIESTASITPENELSDKISTETIHSERSSPSDSKLHVKLSMPCSSLGAPQSAQSDSLSGKSTPDVADIENKILETSSKTVERTEETTILDSKTPKQEVDIREDHDFDHISTTEKVSETIEVKSKIISEVQSTIKSSSSEVHTKSTSSSSESQSQSMCKEGAINKDVTTIKSDFRSYTPSSDDFDIQDTNSPRSDVSAGHVARVVCGWTGSDDEMTNSPLSTTSQAPCSPPSKFTYETEYELQRSSSGVSKKSEFDIDDSQDDVPPEYEVASAIPVLAGYKSDPMETSVYGKLPESEPIPITTTIRTVITKQYDEYASSDPDSSSCVSRESVKSSDHRFLDEADLDFEKALEEHRQVIGSDVMSSVTSKYKFSPSKQPPTSAKATEFPLSGVQKGKSIDSKSDAPTTSEVQTKTDEQIQKEKVDERVSSWGKPLGLPSPVQVESQTTPKRERKLMISKTKMNNEKNLRKRSESPIKGKKVTPIYMDLTYVPHNGNSYYSHVEFFKRVRARYYVFSGTEPSRDVYNALLEAKQTWEDKELEVTIIPTYDTDVLGYWVSENEDLLAKYHIDLSPSASRCTINLQDHETSCSAYRLEF